MTGLKSQRGCNGRWWPRIQLQAGNWNAILLCNESLCDSRVFVLSFGFGPNSGPHLVRPLGYVCVICLHHFVVPQATEQCVVLLGCQARRPNLCQSPHSGCGPDLRWGAKMHQGCTKDGCHGATVSPANIVATCRCKRQRFNSKSTKGVSVQSFPTRSHYKFGARHNAVLAAF